MSVLWKRMGLSAWLITVVGGGGGGGGCVV